MSVDVSRHESFHVRATECNHQFISSLVASRESRSTGACVVVLMGHTLTSCRNTNIPCGCWSASGAVLVISFASWPAIARTKIVSSMYHGKQHSNGASYKAGCHLQRGECLRPDGVCSSCSAGTPHCHAGERGARHRKRIRGNMTWRTKCVHLLSISPRHWLDCCWCCALGSSTAGCRSLAQQVCNVHQILEGVISIKVRDKLANVTMICAPCAEWQRGYNKGRSACSVPTSCAHTNHQYLLKPLSCN